MRMIFQYVHVLSILRGVVVKDGYVFFANVYEIEVYSFLVL